MKVTSLAPRPEGIETFRRSRLRFVPEDGGCYVLTTFDREILYIGLASNLRRRIGQHLDNAEKTRPTTDGRAILVFWLQCDDLHKIERTWMNTYALEQGRLPVLNRVYSPTNT